MVKAKLDAIPSETFSSMMDSLTKITGELKYVRGKLDTGMCSSVIQPIDKNLNTDMSNIKPSAPAFVECLMKNGDGEWTEVKREETSSASADDRRYSIVGVNHSQGCHCSCASRSHGMSLLNVSTPQPLRMMSRGI